MKVKFSALAVFKLENLVEFLTDNWSALSAQKFLKTLHSKIEIIRQNPEAFPASKLDSDLRKCVVTKQTSLFYEVKNNEIHVLTIIDNRQNPEKIMNEIKKRFG